MIQEVFSVTIICGTKRDLLKPYKILSFEENFLNDSVEYSFMGALQWPTWSDRAGFDILITRWVDGVTELGRVITSFKKIRIIRDNRTQNLDTNKKLTFWSITLNLFLVTPIYIVYRDGQTKGFARANRFAKIFAFFWVRGSRFGSPNAIPWVRGWGSWFANRFSKPLEGFARLK